MALQFFGGVSNFSRGGGVSNFSGVSNFGGVFPIFLGGGYFKFFFIQIFFIQIFLNSNFFSSKFLLGCPPPDMVTEQPVRILLECILVLLTFNVITIRNSSCGKVMFSRSVCHSVQGGTCMVGGMYG